MNLTQQQLVDQINWERREANASFINPTQTQSLLNRCNKKIFAEPGIKTVPEVQTINFTGSGDYVLNSDFIGDIDLVSGGAGNTATVKFGYLPPDEFDNLVRGYAYTYKVVGKISIFATDINSLPANPLTLNYWSRNIVLNVDGITKQSSWQNVGDTSRLPEDFDNIFIDFVMARITKRDGKAEWSTWWADFLEDLEDLKARGGVPKPNRPKRSFGHYQMAAG